MKNDEVKHVCKDSQRLGWLMAVVGAGGHIPIGFQNGRWYVFGNGVSEGYAQWDEAVDAAFEHSLKQNYSK